MSLNAIAERDVLAALTVLPEDTWDTWDDNCDCMYPRIGLWTNPYLATTLEVRMCCIWKELYQLFPDFVRVTPAFINHNTNQWETEPYEWNGEDDMPASVWYRQMARKEGITVGEARAKYAGQEPPKGTPRPVVELEPQEEAINPVEMLFTMVTGLAEKVAELLEAKDRLDEGRLAGVLPGPPPDSGREGRGHPGAVLAGAGAVAPKRTRRPRLAGDGGRLP